MCLLWTFYIWYSQLCYTNFCFMTCIASMSLIFKFIVTKWNTLESHYFSLRVLYFLGDVKNLTSPLFLGA